MNKQLFASYFRLMRLHQPVGIWLLLWPCWWSLALASGSTPAPKLLLLFGIGAVLMRSAGCIINDIVDRDIDRQVERTRTRPLASGELSVAQAVRLLIVLILLSVVVAAQLGMAMVMWAAFSLALVLIYPVMKRITWWPQLFLGLTFNWGALLGWVAVYGTIELPAILLYVGGIFWTLGYDTIYAHQDKKDDAAIGVKSTALFLGEKTKPAVAVFYALAVIFWQWAGIEAGYGPGLYACLLLALLHFTWQVSRVRLDDPASCRTIFRANIWLGLIVFVGYAWLNKPFILNTIL